MTNIAVIGAQWGDEGKGKIVDWLSGKADIITRFQGGHNAGHTLVINGVTHKLSLLPSGVVREDKICVIGNGVVIRPDKLFSEIADLEQAGISVSPERLFISEQCCLILDLHCELDRINEEQRGEGKIGTTGRGIGPAYEDKAARRAVRVCDLADKDVLRERVRHMLTHHNALRRGYGEPELTLDAVLAPLEELAPKLLPYACAVWEKLAEWKRERKHILLEGAQGLLLDIDHGTYPYVTSSSTHTGQAASGAGIGPRDIDYTLGICKAYTTRVGSGPFPTQIDGGIGDYLGEKGREFGTVTGRKRRCGWFDAVLTRQAVTFSGIDGIALTKLDVLDGLDEIHICTAYRCGDEIYSRLPASAALQAAAQPVYETVPGWKRPTAGATSLKDLPEEALNYIKRIERLAGVRVTVVSTSPERDDTISTAPFF